MTRAERRGNVCFAGGGARCNAINGFTCSNVNPDTVIFSFKCTSTYPFVPLKAKQSPGGSNVCFNNHSFDFGCGAAFPRKYINIAVIGPLSLATNGDNVECFNTLPPPCTLA